ncbi:metallophosphoesterase [Paenibacillus eucommiae]|uniref:Phosphodiesterase n=1 Tax=Paenibacillus eucommiae TaxID=1355755 RepID=A0ABS4IUZ7_9BACL|nr:metallophosphoesterase [Paenibacillus eucommiae]MBP1991417.1 putative phosphodiesterase [Paenibacillus eucommiae]
MPTFDLISDIHLDFWITTGWHIFNKKQSLQAFAASLLPERPSAVLIIAGDLGHRNKQNYKLLKELKNYYSYILLVAGNHDYYMESSSTRYSYAYDSVNRFTEMKKYAQSLSNVYMLDGDIITIDGISYGGCGMWYDFQYGIQILNSNYAKIYKHWLAVSNDAVCTRGITRATTDMFYAEKSKLLRILPHSDVIITHFSPDWSHAPLSRKLDLTTSFYYFDGAPYFPFIKNKIWCFGHLHNRMDYSLHGCRFFNAALGYPQENKGIPKKAIQICT